MPPTRQGGRGWAWVVVRGGNEGAALHVRWVVGWLGCEAGWPVAALPVPLRPALRCPSCQPACSACPPAPPARAGDQNRADQDSAGTHRGQGGRARAVGALGWQGSAACELAGGCEHASATLPAGSPPPWRPSHLPMCHATPRHRQTHHVRAPESTHTNLPHAPPRRSMWRLSGRG